MVQKMVGKTLKSDEVIESITYKIQLKKSLREAKKNGDTRKADLIQLKIDQIEDKLKSSPLSKT
tara:strand:- start:31 stop:222 length:192 start_codon:yes stop_codon:yes gene_type:complete